MWFRRKSSKKNRNQVSAPPAPGNRSGGPMSTLQRVRLPRAQATWSKTQAFVEEVTRQIEAGNDLNLQSARPIIRECVESVKANAMFWMSRIKSRDAFTAGHCLGVATHSGRKLRPRAEILLDADKHPITPRVIDLAANAADRNLPLTAITRPLPDGAFGVSLHGRIQQLMAVPDQNAS